MLAAVSAKMSKTEKCLPDILFNIDIMNLYLLPCFCIFFERRLKSFTRVFMSEVVLENLKVSESLDAY